MDRFKFRIPFYDNENNSLGFKYIEMLEGLGAYNYGTCHHGNLEQCTGLKDKNGKLIYEHDILKDHRGDVCVVMWDSELASFMLYKTDMKSIYSPIDTDITNFEIIGNIHQGVKNENK